MTRIVVELTAGGPVNLGHVEEDGSIRREARQPGEDLSDLPDDVQAEIEAHWTPELVAAWQDARAAALAELAGPVRLPTLTQRQMRLMMLQLDVGEAAIETEIANIEDPVARAAAQIEWVWASRFERDHPLVVQLAAALEFEPEELDALWAYAAEL